MSKSTMNGRDGSARKSFNENKDLTSKSDVQKAPTPPNFAHAAKKRLSGTGSIGSNGLTVGSTPGKIQATQDDLNRGPKAPVKSRPASVRRVPGA